MILLNICFSTPLHGAFYYGHEPIVKLLLESGYNPHIKNNQGNYPESEAYINSIKEILSKKVNIKLLSYY